jgi:hypothetical protein
MDFKKLRWEDPGLIELTNSRRRADGQPICESVGHSAGNCNPNGASAAECFTMGYSAFGYCGEGTGGPGPT